MQLIQTPKLLLALLQCLGAAAAGRSVAPQHRIDASARLNPKQSLGCSFGALESIYE